MSDRADVIVVGAGLAGLVATAELADAGPAGAARRPGAGGRARRPGVLVVRRAVPGRHPRAAAAADQGLARAGLAGLARARPASTATRTCGRGAGPRPTSSSRPARSGRGCAQQGVRFFPIVGWAERGGYGAIGHGNSVPRFHVTWGTGPGVIGAVRPAWCGPAWPRAASSCASGTASTGSRRPTASSTACAARCWRRTPARAGSRRAAEPVGEFALHGRGGRDRDGRHRRQPRAGAPQLARAARHAAATDAHRRARARRRPRCSSIAEAAGGARDQPRPDVALHRGHRRTGTRSGRCHGIRILPGPSSLWLDATGRRLPVPLFPGFDTLGTLEHIMQTGPRAHVVRADPEDHREGVRALGLRAEPRPHRQVGARGAQARVASGAPGPGRGVQAARRRLRRRARPAATGRAA